MGQKETIVDLLKTKGTMTQLALAEAIYGDKNTENMLIHGDSIPDGLDDGHRHFKFFGFLWPLDKLAKCEIQRVGIDLFFDRVPVSF